jgi:hypothetical protein
MRLASGLFMMRLEQDMHGKMSLKHNKLTFMPNFRQQASGRKGRWRNETRGSSACRELQKNRKADRRNPAGIRHAGRLEQSTHYRQKK